ncbi:MAG: serine/threonine protein kinase [Planctomycetia bacterium]|nr:serine/threonine protein kinase [Planctomycetia bacterium]
MTPTSEVPMTDDANLPSGMPFVPSPRERDRLQAAVGRDLGARYAMLGYLGCGAYATVWAARDRVTDDLLAVKRLEARPGRARGFYRELSAMFRLSHPRIVRLINLLETPDGPRYLFLEHCGGGSLRDALLRTRRAGQELAPRRAAVLARQLAEGLAEAHRIGLAHRDLKPENVLFDGTDDSAAVKLADFGLALALQRAGMAGAAGLSGTPIYMAPEQFAGRCLAASDVYALGILLYEMLHGRPPFTGAPEELARQHLHLAPAIAEDLPAPWRAVLHRLLEKEPGQRPTARELLDLLPGA